MNHDRAELNCFLCTVVWLLRLHCLTNSPNKEPLNKGHFGDNINSAVLSFIERLSSFRGSKCTKTIGHVIFGTSNSVL